MNELSEREREWEKERQRQTDAERKLNEHVEKENDRKYDHY